MGRPISKEKTTKKFEVLCTHGQVVYSTGNQIDATQRARDLNDAPRFREPRQDGSCCAPFHTIKLTTTTVITGEAVVVDSLGSLDLLAARLDDLLPSE